MQRLQLKRIIDLTACGMVANRKHVKAVQIRPHILQVTLSCGFLFWIGGDVPSTRDRDDLQMSTSSLGMLISRRLRLGIAKITPRPVRLNCWKMSEFPNISKTAWMNFRMRRF